MQNIYNSSHSQHSGLRPTDGVISTTSAIVVVDDVLLTSGSQLWDSFCRDVAFTI